MVVARQVNDSALSNEILTVAASAFGGNKNDNQKRTAVMTIALSAHAPTIFIEANGVKYAYRRLGQPSGDVLWMTAGSGVVHNEDVEPLGNPIRLGPAHPRSNREAQRFDAKRPIGRATAANSRKRF
jgi:hypothetical protein